MEKVSEERLAKNEAFFRELNERIREAVGRQDSDGHIYEFICECADPSCLERIAMTVPEYEHIRAEPARFVLAPGHDEQAIETVVESESDHVVVEKLGRAREVAEALDPRAA
jgi:hypothetical protein